MSFFEIIKKYFFTSIFIFCFCFTSIYKDQLSTMVYSLPGSGDYKSMALPNSCKGQDGRGDMGPILHAWCWTFKDVTSHVSEIAEAGYRSIQVSPVQKEKPTKADIPGRGKNLSKWHILYQPLNFKIGNCLGNRDEFIEMCEAAHRVGLKIIVDIVANHLARVSNNDPYHASCFEGIDQDLLDLGVDNLFHKTGFECADHMHYCCRFDITQKCLFKLPDLNTGNEKLQRIIIEFLIDLIDCGADGFRFDGAKHIELPKEWDGDFGSDFWPNVIGAVVNRKPDIYIYGEVVPDGITQIDKYLNFMNVTDYSMSLTILDSLKARDTQCISIFNILRNVNSGYFVTCVENHDFLPDTINWITPEDIKLGWAMVAVRRGHVPLFLARPDAHYKINSKGRVDFEGIMGEVPSNTLWKDKDVSEVNKFRKIAADQKECIIKYNRNLYITFRENVGAVIVNLGNSEGRMRFDTKSLEKDNFKWSIDENADIISSNGKINFRKGTLKGIIPKRSICIVYFKSIRDSYAENIFSPQNQPSIMNYSELASKQQSTDDLKLDSKQSTDYSKLDFKQSTDCSKSAPEQPTDYRSLVLPNSCKDEDKKGDMGPVLHAWCWTFKDVIKNLPDISKSGYKSIQISPVQKEKPKEGQGCSKDWSGWYLLYQPLNFKIGNCLGTRDEFMKMCEEAHKLGLKIIVDAVTNHLARDYSQGIDPELMELGKDTLFHRAGFDCGNYTDRRMMTQGDLLRLPDLNTGNEKVQEKIIKFLKDLIDCGADGLRFDAAKHIELPKQYDGDFGSDYWPNVIKAITEYKPDVYIYAEIIQDGCTNSSSYLNYMNITDTNMGVSIVNGVTGRDANSINTRNTPEGWAPENFVTWVESHDTFTEGVGSTLHLSQEDITLGWAIVASKKGSVPLFFVRPTELKGRIGETPVDPLWKDNDISEINKFRRIAADKKECSIKYNRHLYITFRENVGAVIVNLGNSEGRMRFDTKSLEKDNFKWSEDENADIVVKKGKIKFIKGGLKGIIPKRSVCVVYLKSVLGASL